MENWLPCSGRVLPNTFSGVYCGLLGDFCSTVTVSRRSPYSGAGLGDAFTRMFMARILPLSLRSVLFSTTTHRQACSVWYYRAQTSSLCFRLICYKMSVLLVCFTRLFWGLSSLYCFRMSGSQDEVGRRSDWATIGSFWLGGGLYQTNT